MKTKKNIFFMLRFENSDSQLNMLDRLWIILDPISVCHHTTFSVSSCSRLSKHCVEPSLCGPQRTLVTLITTSIGWDTAEWAVVNVVSSGSRGQRWVGGQINWEVTDQCRGLSLPLDSIWRNPLRRHRPSSSGLWRTQRRREIYLTCVFTPIMSLHVYVYA